MTLKPAFTKFNCEVKKDQKFIADLKPIRKVLKKLLIKGRW
jgi:hypothetical protein